MNMKEEWEVKDPDTEVEGATIKQCYCCERHFAVPNEDLENVGDICDLCAKTQEQMATHEEDDETEKVIKMALGS